MTSYKVIQDIEAEDKLVGPLTLRQFIYAAIAALCGYLSVIAIGKGFLIALIVLVPPMVFTGFFAFPWGGDQPTEVWALAKIRYYLKSRRRLWNQTGAKELVTVTAPKHESRQYTNGLSQHEVQSRLTALASTLDTRGWAIKNVSSIPPLVAQNDGDRLLDMSALPQEVPAIGLTPADDILDTSNPTARHLQDMVAASTASHKRQLIETMQHAAAGPVLPTPQPRASTNNWFMPAEASRPVAPVVDTNGLLEPAPAALPAATEKELSEELHEHRAQLEATTANMNLHTIQPLSEQPIREPITVPKQSAPSASSVIDPVITAQTDVSRATLQSKFATSSQQSSTTPSAPVTHTPDPARIQLAARDDLSIATLARMASKKDEGEVIISLHNHNS